MSDFVTNLARRALGEAPQAGVSPSQGAALAHDLALPITTVPAPAPPAIGTIPSAGPAPVMRQTAPPAPAPPAVAVPTPPPMPPPAAPQAGLSVSARPSSPPQDAFVSPPTAMPLESPRPLPAEPVASAEAVQPATAATPRMPTEPSIDMPRGDVDVESPVVQPRAAQPPEPPASRAESPVTTDVRIEAAVPPNEERPLRPRVGPPPSESPFAAPVTLRVPASPPDESREAASLPVEAKESLERAPIAPRVERAVEALTRREPDTSPGSASPVALPQLAQPTVKHDTRRPVEIRIGAIDIYITQPAPGAPPDRPSLAGFEDYRALRHAHFDDE